MRSSLGIVASSRVRAAVGPLASDSFNRANSTTTLGTADVGGAWTAHSGTWGIDTNRAYLVSTTGQAIASLSTSSPNVAVSADVTLSATSNRADTGLVFRVVDNNNYLLVVMNKIGTTVTTDGIRIFKRASGTFTELAATSTAQGHVNGTTYALRVVANAGSLEVFVDNVSKLTHTLSSGDQSLFGANTSHGVRVNASGSADNGGSRFDNFLVVAA